MVTARGLPGLLLATALISGSSVDEYEGLVGDSSEDCMSEVGVLSSQLILSILFRNIRGCSPVLTTNLGIFFNFMPKN